MSEVVESSKKRTVVKKKTRTSLGSPPPQVIQELANATLRNLSVDEILAACGSSSSLDIARIELADTSVDNVVVKGLATQVNCGAAVLHDVRAILELNFTAHWNYDLKWLGNDSGIKVLGSKANTIELHDINLPMLQDFRFEIPEVEIEDVEAAIDPLLDLKLGGSELEGLRVAMTAAPADGFKVSGIDLGNLDVTNLQVPKTRTESVSVESFKPVDSVALPGINLGPISVPAIEIDDVASDGAVSVMGAELEPIEAPVFKIGDLFKVKLVVDPILHLQIGSLVLSDLEASAEIETVSARDINTTVTVQGFSMEGLVLEDAQVGNVALA